MITTENSSYVHYYSRYVSCSLLLLYFGTRSTSSIGTPTFVCRVVWRHKSSGNHNLVANTIMDEEGGEKILFGCVWVRSEDLSSLMKSCVCACVTVCFFLNAVHLMLYNLHLSQRMFELCLVLSTTLTTINLEWDPHFLRRGGGEKWHHVHSLVSSSWI